VTSNLARIVGLILEAIALPFLVAVALLFNMPDKNLGVIAVLLLAGALLFIAGLTLTIFSHIPKEKEKLKNAQNNL
jgi:VIT1/CCC1 family predicted Fe2+/Mn2+ transporter